MTRFGVTYVDYTTQARYPKQSALSLRKWFSEHIAPSEDPSSKQHDDSTGIPVSRTSSVSSAKTNVEPEDSSPSSDLKSKTLDANSSSSPAIVHSSSALGIEPVPELVESSPSPSPSPLSDPVSLIQTPVNEHPSPATVNGGKPMLINSDDDLIRPPTVQHLEPLSQSKVSSGIEAIHIEQTVSS